MERRNDCKIVLETGEVYEGIHFGAKVERVCEIVYNTSMVGYQEIITDPSYATQAVVMTYPIIGNYGITDEDNETKNNSNNYHYDRCGAVLLPSRRMVGCIALINTINHYADSI